MLENAFRDKLNYLHIDSPTIFHTYNCVAVGPQFIVDKTANGLLDRHDKNALGVDSAPSEKDQHDK